MTGGRKFQSMGEGRVGVRVTRRSKSPLPPTAGRDYREGSPLLAVVLFPVMGGAGFGAADLLPWVRCSAAGAVVPGDGQPGPDRDRPGVPWCCGCRCWLLCWCDWGTGQNILQNIFKNGPRVRRCAAGGVICSAVRVVALPCCWCCWPGALCVALVCS